MQAIILAAGMGKRLKEYTKNNTKCMVEVNGTPLIDRVLRQLTALHLDRVILVVGYCADNLIRHIEALSPDIPVQFVRNDVYEKTNNIYSLWLASEYLTEDDTLLLESDLIFEDDVLKLLLDDHRPNLALVDKYESWMDGTCIKTNRKGDILDFISGKSFSFSETSDLYKTVNIYKFSKEFSAQQYVPFLNAYCKAMGNNEYYEQVLKVISILDSSTIRAKKLTGQKWYEIDDAQDLDIACTLFPNDSAQHLQLISTRYGGGWRYPDLIDFCYLVNPFYPSDRMMSEIISNCDKLIRQYPSGMRVNRILASRNFNISYDTVVVGNGAAELISALMSELDGTVGFIRPTFEEYYNRYEGDKEVFFASGPDYTYDADAIISYFGQRKISALILINPDNPSGNYLPTSEVRRLVSWAKERGITLVYDESFSDFADEENHSLLDNAFLAENRNLVVIKSVSKSHGVPGLRLGILATGNTELLSRISQRVAIWNINSLGEFYMQIFEKYRSVYESSLKTLRKERSRMFKALSGVDGLRPIPSQANFITAEITDGTTAEALARALLEDGLLIKDLSPKEGFDGAQYIRLAIRNAKENDLLVQALKKHLGGQNNEK
ncbi:MAG: aminotransferase class I/II-fold pyridoxal phosphate-dependent enzyme [Lachnospiraceae bacterium]|nr:aminotransferase class I/II-fold pyridoxal phosphate-dependent enzyme [Lachnospiraceae bacterium]